MTKDTTLGRLTRGASALAVVTLGIALAAPAAYAGHQWNDYHWQIPTGGSNVDLAVADCQGGLTWNGGIDATHGDWNFVISDAASPAAAPLTVNNDPTLSCPTSASDPIGGFPHAGQNASNDSTWETIYTFDDDYGNNGWLGVAIIEIDLDSHILFGETFLNEYYTWASSFDEGREWRRVYCQETGHVLGLDHVKDLSSCMYSSQRPFVNPSEFPNAHDGDQVVAITDAEGAPPPEPEPDPDGGSFCDKHPDHWKCTGAVPGAGAVPSATKAKATWAERFASEGEMFESADLVVSATVLSGSSLVRFAGRPGRELPVSQVTLRVEDAFKGRSRPVILLEQTRGPGLEIEDDPGYVAGDDYLLYLRQIAANTYRAVNPSGRIRQ